MDQRIFSIPFDTHIESSGFLREDGFGYLNMAIYFVTYYIISQELYNMLLYIGAILYASFS